MFFNVPISGDALADKTICLTYDDGPGATEGSGAGPRTMQLAEYLFARAIPASFFVVGERARCVPDALRSLHTMGHLVANHSERHKNLVALTKRGENPADEVGPTDQLLRDTLPMSFTLFRPPYGAWHEQASTTSPVTKPLNADGSLARCIGPIVWDINAHDWKFWADRRSAEDCAADYLALIERQRRGIVLMHDSSWETELQAGNQALRLATILIPELEARGYRFVRLDDVPQVASAIAVSRRVAVASGDMSNVVSLAAAGDGQPTVSVRRRNTTIGPSEEFGLVELGRNRIALRTPTGHYVSADQGGGGRTSAMAHKLDAWSSFSLSPLDNGRFALRAPNDMYLLTMANGELRADARSVGSGETFQFVDL